MSELDKNVEVLEEEGSGFAGFRAFQYDPSEAHPGACLKSLAKEYWWKQGPLKASGIPTFSNGHGFYAFINLPLAIINFGVVDDWVFCLTRHWETTVQRTETIRSEWAQIVAIIEPLRTAKKDVFPWEALARDYPDVPVIHQNDIPWMIFQKDLIQLPYQEPGPPVQWIDAAGHLDWHTQGTRLEQGAEDLPPAATYPDVLHPVDQRLRKAYFVDLTGERYVFWDAPGQKAFTGLSRYLRAFPNRMRIHLDPDQPEQQGEDV
jgi:hypothetical protein